MRERTCTVGMEGRAGQTPQSAGGASTRVFSVFWKVRVPGLLHNLPGFSQWLLTSSQLASKAGT